MTRTEPEVSGRVSATTRNLLWARAAGHCQYCNNLLIGDLVSGNDKLIRALVAHIVSAKPDGPRGDAVRSPLLVDDIRNLMLLCYEHHRLIDVEDEAGHPEDLLLAMKAAHETRIEIQTSLTEDRQTHILTFGAPIGALEAPLSYPSVRMTVLPERYPAGGRAIHLDIKGCQYRDHEPAYWTFQRENLGRQFRDRIAGRIETGEIRHLSVFGLAPQPLLIELGRLLCDICPADVHQLKREPKGWGWVPDGDPIAFRTQLKLLSSQGCRPEASAQRHRHRRPHPSGARARRADLVHHGRRAAQRHHASHRGPAHLAPPPAPHLRSDQGCVRARSRDPCVPGAACLRRHRDGPRPDAQGRPSTCDLRRKPQLRWVLENY